MPMKVRYTVVNGVVRSENRSGVERAYSLDPLGNTRALYDTTTTRTDTFEYFPSGTVAARTGTTATPFQWVGGSGYYRDNAKRVHVRARNFYVNLGRWAETDPIGFDGGDYNLYRYVKNRFVVMIDPSGLQNDEFVGVIPKSLKDKPDGNGYVGARCNAGNDINAGRSGCNFDDPNGDFKPYSVICATRPIWYGCVAEHELIHRDQLTVCCANFGKCLKRYKGMKDEATKCVNSYEAWRKKTNKPRECEAYTQEETCLQSNVLWYCDFKKDKPSCMRIRARLGVVTSEKSRVCGKENSIEECYIDAQGSITKEGDDK